MQNAFISIIVPLHNEQETLPELRVRVDAVMQRLGHKYELIFVDAGSDDVSWTVIRNLAELYPAVVGLKLSRNFGKESAICAGLDYALGDCAIICNADLSHPPELIADFLHIWQEKGVAIVNGVRKAPESPFLHKLYKLRGAALDWMQGEALYGTTDYKLIDRRAIEAWKLLPERQTRLRSITRWLGLSQAELPIPNAPKKGTRSAFSAVTARGPYHLIGAAGLLCLVVAFLTGVSMLVRLLQQRDAIPNSGIALLLFLVGGTVLLSIAWLAALVGKLYQEVQCRPRYLLQTTTEPAQPENTAPPPAAAQAAPPHFDTDPDIAFTGSDWYTP